MSAQHLSDETVAACADGVLSGHARERAMRHLGACACCAQAVRVQREAAWALRTAAAPSLPSGLLDRLRTLPGGTAPAAAAPPEPPSGPRFLAAAAFVAPASGSRRSRRHRPLDDADRTLPRD